MTTDELIRLGGTRINTIIMYEGDRWNQISTEIWNKARSLMVESGINSTVWRGLQSVNDYGSEVETISFLNKTITENNC